MTIKLQQEPNRIKMYDMKKKKKNDTLFILFMNESVSCPYILEFVQLN